MSRMATPRRIFSGILALMLLIPSTVSAGQRGQAPAAPVNPFETVTSMKCTFQVSAHGTWPMGVPEAQIKSGGTLTMQFVDIDVAESTARVFGLSTVGELVAQLRGWNLHFLDMRSTGGLMVTTVFGQQSRDGKLKAAYTRADYLPIIIPGFASAPEVSQHYGECELGTVSAPPPSPAR